jgi:hypothetical protein
MHRRDGSVSIGHMDKCVRTLDLWRERSNLKIQDDIPLHYKITSALLGKLYLVAYRSTVQFTE